MNIAIWTDNDLDGAGSALALKCLFGDKAKYFIKDVTDKEFIGSFKGWIATEYEKYDKIFITDLFVPDELVPFVDKKNIIIIDHHKSQVDIKGRYTNAREIIRECSSCVNLILEEFHDYLKDKISLEQFALFNLINDYDSYELNHSETLKLNAVYFSLNRPKAENFIEAFKDGLRPFTVFEQNAIKLYFNKYKEQIDTAQFFEGTLKGYKVISCFASYAVNEVAHYTLKKFNADIVFVIIPNSQSVSIRKNKKCPIALNKLAELLCGGGGHEYAAGGKVTDNFLEYTKTLKAIN